MSSFKFPFFNFDTFKSKTFWVSLAAAVLGVLQSTGAVTIPGLDPATFIAGGAGGMALADRLTKVIKP